MAYYDPRKIEQKWQKLWDEQKVFAAKNDSAKPKYYVLDMFPYPSGSGLHVGHLLGYIASDIVARFKRATGFNVLHPMGFDAFGLPAEQYAINTGQSPFKTTEENVKRYKEQLDNIGLSFDWDRQINTTSPSYYKWTQWIFLQLFNSYYNFEKDRAEPIEELVKFITINGNSHANAACNIDVPLVEAGKWDSMSEEEQQALLLNYRLAFLSETTVNWCPALGTVLANDEVKDGFSERGGYPVEQKKMKQWFIRTTAYCDRLLLGLEQLDWPDSSKEMQKNWIGRSVGVNIDFELALDALLTKKNYLKVFTTQPHTLFGVTYIALSREHWFVKELIEISPKKAEIHKYIQENHSLSIKESITDESNGVFTGFYALHPYTKVRLPIYIANYVLQGYGTEAVMGVPFHDERDKLFAEKHGINLTQVISFEDAENSVMINSDFLTGMLVEKAKAHIVKKLQNDGLGAVKVNYKMRDSVYSRQRYWGEPIPIYYKAGVPYALSEDALPLKLPNMLTAKKKGSEDTSTAVHNKSINYLGDFSKWRTDEGFDIEKDTMPSWAGSNWYFLRYMDPANVYDLVDKKVQKYWKGVDLYIGGAEHTTGHLIYSRVITKFLYDIGRIDIEEPFNKLINQGMIQGTSYFLYRSIEDSNLYISYGLINKYNTAKLYLDNSLVIDGELNIQRFKQINPEAKFILEGDKYVCGSQVEKMSKSKYNTVSPDEVVKNYGADALRLYTMFLGPIEQSKPWNVRGIEGGYKFLTRLWGLFFNGSDIISLSDEKPNDEELKIIHNAIKNTREAINKHSFNTVVSNYMICLNKLKSLQCNKKAVLEKLILILAPFAPHIAEELWSVLGHEGGISYVPFPEYEEAYIKEDVIEYLIAVNGKTRNKMTVPVTLSKEEIEKSALADDTIKKIIVGKEIKKLIVVDKKIVNIIV
jgi:leucyl-tRNA synthetase